VVKFDFLQNSSFFDHFKRRSENPKHTFGNNKDLTPAFTVKMIQPINVKAIIVSIQEPLQARIGTSEMGINDAI